LHDLDWEGTRNESSSACGRTANRHPLFTRGGDMIEAIGLNDLPGWISE
jgi:hypothetical protein